MKTYSDQLFELIKAMSPNEKLYFKVFSANKKRPNEDYSYIILFDTLNDMKVYDEAVLQKKLKKARFKHKTEKAKNYLTEALFKSLMEYHTDSSIDVKIHNLFFQAEILYKKNLRKMADQTILKAEKLALEFEKYEYLLMILSLKTNLAVDMSDLESMKELTKSGIKKQLNYRKMYDNTMAYINLLVEIGSLRNLSPDVISADRSVDTRLKKLFDHPLLQDSKTALTFSAKQYFYKLHFQRIRYITKLGGVGDEKTYRILKDWVAYIEKKKDLRNNYPEVYLHALSYLVSSTVTKRGQNEWESIYEKGRDFYIALPKKNMNYVVSNAFMTMFIQYTDAQLSLLQPEKCIEAFVSISKPKLSYVASINMSLAYFLSGRYSEALSGINEAISNKSNFRMDAQALARMLLLIIHYELRNTDLLPYISLSVERWLIKNKYPIGSFDKELIRFFKYKLPKMDSIEEERQELLHLLAYLKDVENTGDSILNREEFYLRPWLEGKIQNRPLMDIAREKMVKKKG